MAAIGLISVVGEVKKPLPEIISIVLADLAAWPEVVWLVDTHHLPRVSTTRSVETPYYLAKYRESLALFDRSGRCRPLAVDMVAQMLRWRSVGHQQHLLAKALSKRGCQADQVVVDATAGWGQDSIAMAVLGCQVIALERHPVMYCLLQTAYRLACQQAPRFGELALEFVYADAIDWLRAPSTEVDSVLIDVMYPPAKRSALNKRAMQTLRQIVGEDQDADNLFASAYHCARRQVLVKRPRQGLPIVSAPTQRVVAVGRSTRCDVYACLCRP